MLNRKSIIFISIGIVCVILLFLTGDKTNPSNETKINYENELEEKLTELISQLGGVSDVRVMVVQECGVEYIYAADKEVSGDREVLKYYKAGEDEALLIKEISPVIKGVAVVCNSTEKSDTKVKITKLVSSVLDIPTTRIFVDT